MFTRIFKNTSVMTARADIVYDEVCSGFNINNLTFLTLKHDHKHYIHAHNIDCRIPVFCRNPYIYSICMDCGKKLEHQRRLITTREPFLVSI